jgi:pyruvate,orthophosphate dikinase
VAIANGAQGIGLTRTEHMFFATHQRIAAVRRMIAAVELGSPAAAEALKELQGYQTQVRGGLLLQHVCVHALLQLILLS